MRERYKLGKLDCAACAAKAERAIQKTKGVRFASIDFATMTLDLEADDPAAALATLERVEPGLGAERLGGLRRHDPPGPARPAPVAACCRDGSCAAAPSAPATPAHGQAQDKEPKPRAPWLSPLLLALSLLALVASFAVAELLGDGRAAGAARWPVMVLAAVAWLAAGRSVLWQALRNLRRGAVFDENFLMAAASIGAFALGEFREAAAVMVFFLIGETLQDRAVDRSRASIGALLALKPDRARRLTPLPDGSLAENEVPSDEILPGELVRVRPGERVPADGRVARGEGNADTAALTGESLPRSLEPGSEVLAGFVLLDAALDIEVAKPAAESSAARIVAMVEDARANKAATERFITRFARWYTPAVVGLAIASALALGLFFGQSPGEAIHRALVMLVISCPCALVVSVPLAYFGGIGGAARRGILVKGAAVFDALHRVKAAVFDKTGTLTEGIYELKSFHPARADGHAELLHWAVVAEQHSNHPAARAIRAASDGVPAGHALDDYQELAGYGVLASHQGVSLLAGGHRLLHRQNIPHDCRPETGTHVHVARGGIHLGSIAIGDRIKDDAAQAVAELRGLGVGTVVMLTGDSGAEAERVGQAAGLDSWRASCLPEDKLAELEAVIAATKGSVLFAGDGINDAPVIARADVGVAMGLGGQDAAIESADVVIMNDSPAKVVEAIRIARRTRSIVIQNIAFALAVKALFLAAGGFGLAGMWEAVVADVGVALIAVLNSLRALAYREPRQRRPAA